MRASFRFLGTPWVLDDVFKEIDFDLDGEIEGDELWEWCRGVRDPLHLTDCMLITSLISCGSGAAAYALIALMALIAPMALIALMALIASDCDACAGTPSVRPTHGPARDAREGVCAAAARQRPTRQPDEEYPARAIKLDSFAIAAAALA